MEKNEYAKKQRSYTIGYVLSALLTVSIYWITVMKLWNMTTLAVVALVAAALQMIVQSRFFLHLKSGEGYRWKLISYVFTWIMLLIVVIGSLWVMMNLNYNMRMSPSEMLQSIQSQNGKGF